MTHMYVHIYIYMYVYIYIYYLFLFKFQVLGLNGTIIGTQKPEKSKSMPLKNLVLNRVGGPQALLGL